MKKYKINADEREVYDKLNDDLKKKYAYMTHAERKKYSMMGKKEGTKYMYACTSKNESYTGKTFKDEVFNYVNASGKELSESNQGRELKENHYFCKYCGTGFTTEEEVDKHQRTCALTI